MIKKQQLSNPCSPDDPLSLTTNSTVCYTYYMYFNRILKQLQDQGNQIQIPAIGSVVGKLSESMHTTEEKGEDITRDNYLDLVLWVETCYGNEG